MWVLFVFILLSSVFVSEKTKQKELKIEAFISGARCLPPTEIDRERETRVEEPI
jgi:hypothetical protein